MLAAFRLPCLTSFSGLLFVGSALVALVMVPKVLLVAIQLLDRLEMLQIGRKEWRELGGSVYPLRQYRSRIQNDGKHEHCDLVLMVPNR